MTRGKLGEVLGGRFRLERHLATGAFGEVWRARDSEGVMVALKILHAKHLKEPRVRARFDLEARLLLELVHPNIARAIECRSAGDLAYIAIELVPGETLAQRLDGLTVPPAGEELQDLLSVFHQLCVAIEFAHQLGVLHRDIKPSNVMIIGRGPSAVVKVLDFGVAKILGADHAEATTQGRVIGTPSYLSPEQLMGLEVDHRSDVFALAVNLYEMLTLRRAWHIGEDGEQMPVRVQPKSSTEGLLALCQRIVRGPRPSVSRYRGDLAAGADELIRSALSTLSFERPSSAADLDRAVRDMFGFRSQASPGRKSVSPPAPAAAFDASGELTLVAPTSMEASDPQVSFPAGPALPTARTLVVPESASASDARTFDRPPFRRRQERIQLLAMVAVSFAIGMATMALFGGTEPAPVLLPEVVPPTTRMLGDDPPSQANAAGGLEDPPQPSRGSTSTLERPPEIEPREAKRSAKKRDRPPSGDVDPAKSTGKVNTLARALAVLKEVPLSPERFEVVYEFALRQARRPEHAQERERLEKCVFSASAVVSAPKLAECLGLLAAGKDTVPSAE